MKGRMFAGSDEEKLARIAEVREAIRTKLEAWHQTLFDTPNAVIQKEAQS
jgi:hypothetical protein